MTNCSLTAKRSNIKPLSIIIIPYLFHSKYSHSFSHGHLISNQKLNNYTPSPLIPPPRSTSLKAATAASSLCMYILVILVRWIPSSPVPVVDSRAFSAGCADGRLPVLISNAFYSQSVRTR